MITLPLSHIRHLPLARTGRASVEGSETPDEVSCGQWWSPPLFTILVILGDG
jgi:hypothetical protein